MQQETFPSPVTWNKSLLSNLQQWSLWDTSRWLSRPGFLHLPSSLVSGVRVQPVSRWNTVPSPIWHRMNSQKYTLTVLWQQGAGREVCLVAITSRTECQLWLSFCDSLNLIYSLGLSLSQTKFTCHLSHLMYAFEELKPTQNHTKTRFTMPDMYHTLHLGLFKCSFVCCLNALCFNCVRLWCHT